jgi:hypothetical protein
MFVRFLCDWPPYKLGQALEIPDRVASHFVARCMAETVTAADVQAYARTMETIDRAIEKRINAMPARAAGKTAGRREITEDQWASEIGRDRPGYRQAQQAHRQAQQLARLPAEITVR